MNLHSCLLVMATLASFLPDAAQLRRLLRQDWITSWDGWQVASSIFDTCHSDETSQEVALQTIQEFSRISLQNVDVEAMSDDERKAELEAAGKYLGIGLVHGNNECCSDSLLQLLARCDLVSSHLTNDVAARRVAC